MSDRMIDSLWLSQVTGRLHSNTLKFLNKVANSLGILHNKEDFQVSCHLTVCDVSIPTVLVNRRIATIYLRHCNSNASLRALRYLQSAASYSVFNPLLTPGCFLFLTRSNDFYEIRCAKSVNNAMHKIVTRSYYPVDLLHVLGTNNISKFRQLVFSDLGYEEIINGPFKADPDLAERFISLYPLTPTTYRIMHNKTWILNQNFFPIGADNAK